jgi:hypothetical protein
MVGHVPAARTGDHRVTLPAATLSLPRREVLLDGLLDTVALLQGRRAAEITEGFIDGYVALNWLEWNGGTLRLTVTGDNIRKQLKAQRPL